MDAIEALTKNQKQLDEDGVMVGVSREAIEDVVRTRAEFIEKLDRMMTAEGVEVDGDEDEETIILRALKDLIEEKNEELEEAKGQVAGLREALVDIKCNHVGTKYEIDPIVIASQALSDTAAVAKRVLAMERVVALREAGDWFKAWKDMPASYERAGEALHRMAEEAKAKAAEGGK